MFTLWQWLVVIVSLVNVLSVWEHLNYFYLTVKLVLQNELILFIIFVLFKVYLATLNLYLISPKQYFTFFSPQREGSTKTI